MRNLKRALSLAMASVMLLGLMVVGAGASYSDVASKHNVEAIEVLQAVGVMVGDDKGNFNPDQNVTRNEMAVVMANLLSLKISDFNATSIPFTDVPAWAAPYVAACYADGIVAGTSKTTYGGNATVTAAQAGLMMLKALGYFQYQADFGDDWQIATIKQASKIDLYDDINVGVTASMTRNDVAQLALNTLEATMVQTDGTPASVTTPDGTTVNMGSVKYEDVMKSGTTYQAIKKGDADNGKYTVQLGEELYKGDLKKTADTSDDLGRPSSKWTYKGTIGTYADSANAVYTDKAKSKDIYADLGLSQNQTATTYTDGYYNSGTFGLTKTSSNEIGAKGTVTEAYVDDDDNVTLVSYNYYLAQATGDYDENDEELDIKVLGGSNLVDTLSVDDFALVATFADEDYMVVTVAQTGASDYAVVSVQAIELIEDAVVSGAKTDSYVTADGTKYNYAVYATDDSNALGVDLMDGTSSYKLNSDGYNLYLDPNGYVIGVEGFKSNSSVDDYLFVKNAGSSNLDAAAKVVFMDGTSKTITVAKLDGNETFTWTTAQEGKFYTFTEKKNGNYELTTVANQATTGTPATIESKAQPIDGVTKTANSSTVFVAKDKVYVGVKNAPKVPASLVSYVWDTKNTTRLLAVYTATAGSAKSSADELVYILSNKSGHFQDADENDYYVYDAIVDGKKTTLNASAGGKAVGLYKIDSYSDGYADLGTAISASADLVNVVTPVTYASIDYKDDVLTLNATDSFVLASDVKVFTIDGTTVKSISASAVKNAVKEGFSGTAYVVEKSSSDDEIATVYLTKVGAPSTSTAVVAADVSAAMDGGNTGDGTVGTITVLGNEIRVAVNAGGTAFVSGDKINVTIAGTLTSSATTANTAVTLTYNGATWVASNSVVVVAADTINTATYTVKAI